MLLTLSLFPFVSMTSLLQTVFPCSLSKYIVCPRRLDSFYKVTHYIEWAKTSWTHSSLKVINNLTCWLFHHLYFLSSCFLDALYCGNFNLKEESINKWVHGSELKTRASCAGKINSIREKENIKIFFFCCLPCIHAS